MIHFLFSAKCAKNLHSSATFARALRIWSGKQLTNISINSVSCSAACLRQRICFQQRISPREASSGVRTYRFCPFFKGLRYVFTFAAVFQPVRSLKRSQNVSFLSVFQGFTIRFHFCSGVSASAEPQAESERIVFARFSRVYDTFSLFQRRFSPRGASCTVWEV